LVPYDPPADLFPLLLAVWSEATRNPALVTLADEILGTLRGLITGMLACWSRSSRGGSRFMFWIR